MNKYRAFTLAEVLITLGIIGVVAAMTMPSLIANYQKQVWVNQLKKSVSVLEQGFHKMLADEEVERLSDISEWADINYSIILGEGDTDSNVKFVNYIKKYFESNYIVLDYKYKLLSGYVPSNNFGDYHIVFSDGSMLNPDTYFLTNGAILHIDVNGVKRPNVYGRDIFVFELSDSGNLVPLGGQNSFKNWKTDSLLCGQEGNKDVSYADGDGCAARIIENGWKMDY